MNRYNGFFYKTLVNVIFTKVLDTNNDFINYKRNKLNNRNIIIKIRNNGDIHAFGRFNAVSTKDSNAFSYGTGYAKAIGDGDATSYGSSYSETHGKGTATSHGYKKLKKGLRSKIGDSTAYGSGNATSSKNGESLTYGRGDAFSLSGNATALKTGNATVGDKYKNRLKDKFNNSISATTWGTGTATNYEDGDAMAMLGGTAVMYGNGYARSHDGHIKAYGTGVCMLARMGKETIHTKGPVNL